MINPSGCVEAGFIFIANSQRSDIPRFKFPQTLLVAIQLASDLCNLTIVDRRQLTSLLRFKLLIGTTWNQNAADELTCFRLQIKPSSFVGGFTAEL